MSKISVAIRHLAIVACLTALPQAAAGSEQFETEVGQLSALLRLCGDNQARVGLDERFGSSDAYRDAREDWYSFHHSAGSMIDLDCASLKDLATGLDPAQPRSLPAFRIRIYIDP